MTGIEKRLLRAKIEKLERLYAEVRKEESNLNRFLDSNEIETYTNDFEVSTGYLQEGYSKPLIDYIEECIGEKL